MAVVTWLALKALPWKWIGAGLLAAGLLGYQHHRESAAEQRGYDRSVAENNAALAVAVRDKQLAEAKVKEADGNARQARFAEVESLRAEYAARPGSVIRVCLSPPSGPGPVPGAGSDPGGHVSGAPGTGSLQEGTGHDAGTDFDPTPLYDQARQCDEIVAAFRAVKLRNATAF